MTRARYPDQTGYLERGGVRVFWERYGDGEPTVLFLPTWTIFPSRCWKAQIPYALAVIDATATEKAVIAALSNGTQRALLLAADHPERVLAAAFIAPFFQSARFEDCAGG